MNTNHCNFFFVDLQLQDLAVSPDIRDPSLNTAQCVIQGHKPKFSDTKGHIGNMLLVCNLFVINAGLIFSWAIVDMKKFNRLRDRKIKNTVTAMCVSIHFLSVLCILYFVVACGLAFHFSDFVFSTLLTSVIIWTLFENFFFYVSMDRLSFSYVNRKLIKAIFCLLYTFGGNTICYISYWLVIGIRINPSWGLTVAFSIISFFAALTYAVYLYLEVIYPNGYNIRERENTLQDFFLGTYTLSETSYRNPLSSSASNDHNSQNNNDPQNRVIALFKSLTSSQRFSAIHVCIRGCTAVGCFFIMVILAGPSIAGQTAADELLKTASLYFITAFITWATLKKHSSIDTPLQNERPQNAEEQDTDHHTGDHPGGELGTRLVQNNYYYYNYYHDDRRVSYEHSYITRETRV